MAPIIEKKGVAYMRNYIIRRILQIIPVLFIASVITFSLIHLVPGCPATMMLGDDATPQAIDNLRRSMGLDRPVPIQYLDWVTDMLQGDFGRSVRDNRLVLPALLQRIPTTFELMFLSLIISLLISVPVGIISAVYQDKVIDHAGRVVALMGMAMPNFWLALLLIYWVGFRMDLLPMYGRGGPVFTSWVGFKHAILPSITLGTAGSALIMRLLRSSMLEVLRQDYIRTARSKGLRERIVIMKHALRNSVLSVITVVVVSLNSLIGGSVIVESIFSWPGMGKFTFDRFIARDIPMVMGGLMFFGLVFCLSMVLVDILYAVLDPRIRYD